METFNWTVFLWQVSFVISVVTLLYGLYKKSWISMLVSFITSLPVAYYFLGANNAWKLVAIIPVILLVLTVVLYKKG